MFEASDARGIELKGTFDFTGGTGKYKGITGKNAWRSVGWWVGRTIFNNAQPRKVPVLGLLGSRNTGNTGGGPDFFDGMQALGWTDNYTPG